MAANVDQKAYLQKYLSGPSGDKKKKKKKVSKGRGFKIIDDDVDLTKLRPLEGDELDILGEGEDAPVIAGIIDERPEEIRKLEQFKTSSKWRVINQDDGFNSKLQIEEIKRDIKEVEKENEIIFGKMYSDSEDEQKNDSDLSPPRKQSKYDQNQSSSAKKPQNNSDSDFSPPRKSNDKHSDKNKDKKSHSESRTKSKRNSSPEKRDTKSKKEARERHSERKEEYQRNSEKQRVRKPSRWGDADDVERNRRSHSNSPRRKKQRQSSSDLSPPRQRKNSPPKKNNYESDLSPPRKSRKDIKYDKPDSDISPPRKRRSPPNDKHGKQTSSQRKRKSSDSDLSPPRKSHKRQKSQSPVRKSRKHSPKSVKRKNESDSDLSPPRKRNNKDSRYISNNKRRNDSDSDLSPPRRQKNRDERETNSVRNNTERDRNSDSPPPSNKKMAKTLEGKKAGLQDALQLRIENEEFRRRQDEAFKKMSDEISGRNAQVVARKGKRETSEERQKQREKQERQKELDEKYKKWNRGLKQIQDQEARVQEFMHEASKPLARHRDDEDLERSLKQVERAGDPMLQYMREKRRERGELGPEKPQYKGKFPPNRFNIRPGYRWDGVDRSNGYEKKYFEQQSKRKAQEEEAYKWSTEDL